MRTPRRLMAQLSARKRAELSVSPLVDPRQSTEISGSRIGLSRA